MGAGFSSLYRRIHYLLCRGLSVLMYIHIYASTTQMECFLQAFEGQSQCRRNLLNEEEEGLSRSTVERPSISMACY